MGDKKLLRIILYETVRSPNRQADWREVRRLYGPGFDSAYEELIRFGYISETPALAGHIALTVAGLAVARRR